MDSGARNMRCQVGAPASSFCSSCRVWSSSLACVFDIFVFAGALRPCTTCHALIRLISAPALRFLPSMSLALRGQVKITSRRSSRTVRTVLCHSRFRCQHSPGLVHLKLSNAFKDDLSTLRTHPLRMLRSDTAVPCRVRPLHRAP